MTPTDLLAALSDPAAYPHRPPGVTTKQTHISMVFLAGDRVYKVKKPVDFGFLDFTTPDRRRHFCEEEVRLNRRLAPDVYRGVVPIAREADGRLRVGGDGEAVEWAVEMQRLPDDATLRARVDNGTAAPADVETLAQLFVRQACKRNGLPKRRLGKDALVALRRLSQPRTRRARGPRPGGGLRCARSTTSARRRWPRPSSR